MESAGFTSTSLLAAATDVLLGAGFKPASVLPEHSISGNRVFEDPYSIAAVAVYETWSELSGGWLESQSALARLIAEHYRRVDAKVWEGYLVLLTPSIVPTSDRVDATDLRRNTQHLRKLLGTGDELTTVADVERVLLPLLPLPDAAGSSPAGSALEMLPSILAEKGLRRTDVKVVIDAFTEQQPVIERLHEHLVSGGGGE